MTCDLICCRVDRARADRGPGRRNLQPLYSPAVAVTRDTTAAGDPTPRRDHTDAPEPLTSPGLGSTVALGQTSTPTEHAAAVRMVAGDGGVGVLVWSGARRHG